MIVSRPKTVMNHGIPAARLPKTGEAELRMRGARIGDRLVVRVREVVPAGAELRDAQPPGGERLAHVQQLVAEPPLDEARRDALAVERRDDRDLELPRLARPELDRVGHRVVPDVASLREDDLRPRRAVDIGEQELVLVLVVLGRRGGGSGGACIGSPSAKSCAFTERMSAKSLANSIPTWNEIGLAAFVPDQDPVLHALTDEPAAEGGERVLRQAAREQVAEVETPPRSTRPWPPTAQRRARR